MDILTDRRSANDNIHNGVIIRHRPLILKIGAGFPIKACALTLGGTVRIRIRSTAPIFRFVLTGRPQPLSFQTVFASDLEIKTSGNVVMLTDNAPQMTPRKRQRPRHRQSHNPASATMEIPAIDPVRTNPTAPERLATECATFIMTSMPAVMGTRAYPSNPNGSKNIETMAHGMIQIPVNCTATKFAANP